MSDENITPIPASESQPIQPAVQTIIIQTVEIANPVERPIADTNVFMEYKNYIPASQHRDQTGEQE